ncbi:MAG: polynucleotide kinase 3-phosphatase-like, partial [uncultured Thermomicrobiales bacterium]
DRQWCTHADGVPPRALGGSHHLRRPARVGQIDLLQGAFLQHPPARESRHAPDPPPRADPATRLHRNEKSIRRRQHQPDRRGPGGLYRAGERGHLPRDRLRLHHAAPGVRAPQRDAG